jgi:hypothetical protein
MLLNFGGDDITEFLAVLLGHIKFPYRNIDLNRIYDFNLMEDLKSRICSLAEVSCNITGLRRFQQSFLCRRMSICTSTTSLSEHRAK